MRFTAAANTHCRRRRCAGSGATICRRTGRGTIRSPGRCARLHGLPPAFLAITELDPLHDENVAMAEALRAAGVAVEATVYPGTTHGFLEAMSVAKVSRRAIAGTARWLQTRLGG